MRSLTALVLCSSLALGACSDDEVSSSADVGASGAVTGDEDGTAFTGDVMIDAANAQFGRFMGSLASGPLSGPLTLLMSADKQFVGGFACEMVGPYPTACTFYTWLRQ